MPLVEFLKKLFSFRDLKISGQIVSKKGAGTPAPLPSRLIIIKDKAERPPEFDREYITTISSKGKEFKLELHASYYGYGNERSYVGYLYQSEYKYIYFNPKEIADKIIDTDLVPIVIDACNEMIKIDRAFAESNHNTFKDEKGVTWRRVELLD